MNTIDAFNYVLERLSTQSKLYDQSHDTKYLDNMDSYLRTAMVYVSQLRKENSDKIYSTSGH